MPAPRAVPPWEMGKYKWLVPVQAPVPGTRQDVLEAGMDKPQLGGCWLEVLPVWHGLMESVDIRDICFCNQELVDVLQREQSSTRHKPEPPVKG